MIDTIKHHLTDDILMAYSAGTLPEAFNLIVASHISLCDVCRVQSESFDIVGGALLETGVSSDIELSADSLAATFALIDAEPTANVIPKPYVKGVLPAPIQDYVGGDLDAVKWRPIGMGVKQAVLPTTKDATARLLYIPAGVAMPDHGHQGMEMTLVLQGAFLDDDDYFACGDVEIADSDLHHTPIAEIHTDCICLAVTDAPLKFKGIIPRIVQRFIDI
jgi:putative transcriptional regulator